MTYKQALKRFSKDAFVCPFMNRSGMGKENRLITYNLTTFIMINEIMLYNYPQEIIVLNDTHILLTANSKRNQLIIKLPNVIITNQINNLDYE
jgi:hypothetical protein